MNAVDAIDVIRAVVRDELAASRSAAVGVVSASHHHEAASDTNNYECDVTLRDSGLELKRVPIATPRIGLVVPPNEGDLVLLQFLEGDLHAPVVIGRLYNDEDRPPVGAGQELVYESVDAAQSGVRRAALTFPNGNTLELDDDQVVVSMGSTRLTIQNGGDVLLEGAANVDVQSSGSTSIQSSGDLTLSATGSVSISGADVSVESSGALGLSGTSTEVQGASVAIKGMTEFTTG